MAHTAIINVGGLIEAVLASVFGIPFPPAGRTYSRVLVAALEAVAFGMSSRLPANLLLGGLPKSLFILLNTTTWIWAPQI